MWLHPCGKNSFTSNMSALQSFWRQGSSWFEPTCIFSGIHFTKHFTEFVLMKQTYCLVVIQTWSWHGKPLQSALEHGCGKQTPSASILFSVRICYIFLISKCRGESDLDLCMTSGLAKRMPLRCAQSRLPIFKTFLAPKFIFFSTIFVSHHCAAAFSTFEKCVDFWEWVLILKRNIWFEWWFSGVCVCVRKNSQKSKSQKSALDSSRVLESRADCWEFLSLCSGIFDFWDEWWLLRISIRTHCCCIW